MSHENENAEQEVEQEEIKLSAEDQARVDRVISSGVNSIERKPFRPMLLLLVIWLVLTALGGVSWLIARSVGVV